MTALVFGLFGLIIGSFLNVVILRRRVKTLGGRSVCTHCGHQLSVADLVPVFSYLALRGRCRYCGGKISAQYPIVEAITALSFTALGAAPVPFLLQLLALPIAALFIVIGFYDGRHTIIPDEWVWPLGGLALIFGALYSGDALSAVLSALGAAAPFAFLWLISRGRWMGLGDAKLALAIGALLGPWDTYLALTAAFVLGALFFVPQLAVAAVEKRRGTSAASYTMSSEVPFGPFLILACVFLWLLALYGSDPAAFLFAGSL